MENIAGGGFVRDRQALFPGPSRHVAEEVFGEEVADDPPPVVQKARGLFRGCRSRNRTGLDPFSQAVARAFDEFFSISGVHVQLCIPNCRTTRR